MTSGPRLLGSPCGAGSPASSGRGVAAVPDERPDYAEMAPGIVEVLSATTWSNDDLVAVRIGVASGPALAEVIGRRKFTNDLWATQ
jgi:hypothetical protein